MQTLYMQMQQGTVLTRPHGQSSLAICLTGSPHTNGDVAAGTWLV